MIPVITPARLRVNFQLAPAKHTISRIYPFEVLYRGEGMMAECIAEANRQGINLAGCLIDGMTLGAALNDNSTTPDGQIG